MMNDVNGKVDSPLNHQLSSQLSNLISNMFIIHQADASASVGMLRHNTNQVITIGYVYMYNKCGVFCTYTIVIAIWSINNDDCQIVR